MNIPTKIVLLFTVIMVFGYMGIHAGPEENGYQITILYDNYKFVEGTTPKWGFSCLIENSGRTILFDTGGVPMVLQHNMNQLKKDPADIDCIVITHDHNDHTGGLPYILKNSSQKEIYVPYPLKSPWDKLLENHGVRQIHVKAPMNLFEKIYLTGQMGDQIKEQSLIIDSLNGLIVITGCSHPGIVDIVRKAREIVQKKIHMVFGGFHLMSHSDAQIDRIISDFKKIGVEKLGATHCTGDRAIGKFRKAFGKNFITMGTGRTLKIR